VGRSETLYDRVAVTPARFAFRAVRPLFDFDTVTLAGRAAEGDMLDLYTASGEDAVGMRASLQWKKA